MTWTEQGENKDRMKTEQGQDGHQTKPVKFDGGVLTHPGSSLVWVQELGRH